MVSIWKLGFRFAFWGARYCRYSSERESGPSLCKLLGRQASTTHAFSSARLRISQRSSIRRENTSAASHRK